MLYLDINGLDPKDQAYGEFWNTAHSTERFGEGWVLALWYQQKPTNLPKTPSTEGGIVALGWPPPTARRKPRIATAPLSVVTDFPSLLVPSTRVVLACWDSLPPQVRRVLAERLNYDPRLANQVDGWWFTDGEEPPAAPLGYRPTGAFLPEGGELEDGTRCLVLVELDYFWMVLSEVGARSYVFGSRLIEGDDVTFLDASGAS